MIGFKLITRALSFISNTTLSTDTMIMIYELQFNVNNYGVGELRMVRRFPNKRRFASINRY